jgi:hypothetical protein
VRSRVALGTSVLFAVFPSWMPGFAAAYTLGLLEHLSIGAVGRGFFAPSTVDLAGDDAAKVRSFDAELALCTPTNETRLGLSAEACLGFIGSRHQAEGRGFERSARGRLWDASVRLGAGVRWRLGRGLSVLLEASARVRLGQASFERTTGDGRRVEALEPGRVGAMVALGPAYEF